MPVAPGMVAPLDGTPDDQGVSAGTPEGGKKNKSGGPRRKVGRWSEEETNTLILLTNQACWLLLLWQQRVSRLCSIYTGPLGSKDFKICSSMCCIEYKLASRVQQFLNLCRIKI